MQASLFVHRCSSSCRVFRPFCAGLAFFKVRSLSWASLLLAASAAFFSVASAQAATPNFIQSNYAVPQTPQSKVTVVFSAAQRPGDLNVIIVGWGDATSQVSSVTDSKGNPYLLAVGPTVLTGSAPLTQAIYYAKNIASATAGANSVTLSF